MVVYVYRFEVLAGRDADFEQAWAEVTRGYQAHAGSLGSRLHRDERGIYWAYAQWPSRAAREGANLDAIAGGSQAGARMTKACLSSSCEHVWDVENDLLKIRQVSSRPLQNAQSP